MVVYAAGANFERLVKKYYEDNGYFTLRSAGSRGPVDVMAWRFSEVGVRVILIQCKRYKGDQKVPKSEFESLKAVPAEFEWNKRVFVKRGRKIEEYDLTGELINVHTGWGRNGD